MNNITDSADENKGESKENSKKYSLKGTEDAAELKKFLESLTAKDTQLKDQQQTLRASAEYQTLDAAIRKARESSPSRFNPSPALKTARENMLRWEETSGYRAISREREQLDTQLRETRKEIARRAEQAAEVPQESPEALKERQFRIVQSSNPMHDDYHTGIRNAAEIKTYQEAWEESKAEYPGENFTPDYTQAMAKKALRSGKITLYSSYPIRPGGFVTPSKMEAESYAGTPHGYKITAPLTDVAWINIMEGQYTGKPGGSRYSLKGTEDAERLAEIVRQNEAERNPAPKTGSVPGER